MPAWPAVAQLTAAPQWAQVDFISDIHLHPQDPATFAAWRSYLQHTTADAVFILGDLFEVWVGDDTLQAAEAQFESDCVAALHAASQRLALFIQHGNRDFLMGPALLQACGATAISDPCALRTPHADYLLSHGDALCLDDQAYMAFRTQVRSPHWQQQFLSQPLAQRQALARQMRAQSASQQGASINYADADTTLALQWLQQHQAQHLIHGHTHRPACHVLDATHQRWVLSDWDCSASPPRAQVLRLHCASGQLERLPPSAY